MKKIILVIVIILSGCTPVPPVGYLPSTAPLIPTTIKSTRCVPASAAQITGINEGVQQIDKANSITSAWSFKSADFSQVYMVAARVHGPGLTNYTIGVWAIGGTPDSPGLILAVDGIAQTFSPYPDASKAKAQITQSDDGVAEARTCAQQNE